VTGEDRLPFASLVRALGERSLVLGAAESLTGGLFAFLVTREEGAGEAFRGSLVTYQTEAKRLLLGVGEPVISAAAAERMAEAALRQFQCHVAVSLTGVAGPETQEGMPVGTVFIGVATQSGTATGSFHFEGKPDQIRFAAAAEAARMAEHSVGSAP
jgi:PncC family amidohydrolase